MANSSLRVEVYKLEKQKEINFRVVLVAMVCLTLLEVVALLKGINGIILSMVLATIAGLAGYVIPPKIKLK